MEIQPRKATAKGTTEWFTGDAWIDTVAEGRDGSELSVIAVRFTPGARTAWHAHRRGQTLYVTEGHGRIQSRGGDVADIRAGDVVYAPPGEWHWHGATPDHFMSHLSITEAPAEWGDHVTDAEYDRG